MRGEGEVKQQKEKALLPKNDVIFKNLFSKTGNEEMLKELLEEITKVKIYDIEVEKEVELSQMKVGEKYGRLDLRAIINKHSIVIIEMQMNDTCDMKKRMMYYGGKVLSGSLDTKQTYDQIKDIHIISILNYEMTELDKYCSDSVTVDSQFREYELVKGLKFYFIELPKFRKKARTLETKLEQWLAFIDYEEMEMVKMAIEKNKLVQKAQQEYEYLTGEAAERRLQELREKAILDENSAYATGKKRGQAIGEQIGERRGEKRGEKRGRWEEKIAMAKAMMQNKVKQDIIAKCTGLSNIELNKIANSIIRKTN